MTQSRERELAPPWFGPLCFDGSVPVETIGPVQIDVFVAYVSAVRPEYVQHFPPMRPECVEHFPPPLLVAGAAVLDPLAKVAPPITHQFLLSLSSVVFKFGFFTSWPYCRSTAGKSRQSSFSSLPFSSSHGPR